MKIGYQLKQVRERLAKGLVDKGILRTEKRNFLLFDMATHPVAEGAAKDEIRRRVRNVLTQRTIVLNASQFLPEEMEYRYLRTIAMVCAAYAANVLENALATLGHEARERAFAQVDELLAEYSQWPFVKRQSGQQGVGANLSTEVTNEINNNKDKELQLEVSLVLMGLSLGTNHSTGRCGMFECFHQTGLFALSDARLSFWSSHLRHAWLSSMLQSHSATSQTRRPSTFVLFGKTPSTPHFTLESRFLAFGKLLGPWR